VGADRQAMLADGPRLSYGFAAQSIKQGQR
jgi:hypothetical protein